MKKLEVIQVDLEVADLADVHNNEECFNCINLQDCKLIHDAYLPCESYEG